jgi:acyl-CoA thioester hydrolase
MPAFEKHIVAEPGDIDELGHVSNLVYLRWVQDAATAHSGSLGWDLPAYKKLGSVWVVRKHEIEYLRSALEGDELILRTWVADWRGASSRRDTRILRKEGREELVRASTRWAFVDANTGRPQRVPKDLIELFGVGED